MTAIERHEPSPVVPMQAFNTMYDQAKVLCRSSMVPKQYRGQPDNVVVAALTGLPFGWDVMTSMRCIDVIEGTAAIKPQAMLGLIRSRGHKVEITLGKDKAVAVGTRGDDGTSMTVEFGLADAQRAGLAGKAVWKAYPAAMCMWRAVSMLARAHFSDVTLGLAYVPEELGAHVTEDGETVVSTAGAVVMDDDVDDDVADAEVVDPSQPSPEQLKKIATMYGLLESFGLKGDRRAQFALVEVVTGRSVASHKDLTRDEASRLIDVQERLLSGELSPTYSDDELICDLTIVLEGDESDG